MTNKERILNAIYRKNLDKFPIQVDFSPKMLDKIQSYLNLSIKGEEELQNFTNNHLIYAYLNDPFGKIRKRGVTKKEIFDDWGVGWDGQQEGTFFTYHPLSDKDNYIKYKFPDPYVEDLMDFTKEAVAKYKEDFLVSSYQVVCLFERAWALRGFENFMMDMMLDEDFAETLLEKIMNYQIEIAKRYICEGVECGRTGDDYGGQNGMLFSPVLWRKMIKPRLKKIIKVYKDAGLPVIHHSCGDVRPIIDDLIELGVDVLNNVQSEAMPIKELTDKFGERITFYGGISTQEVLPFGNPDEVKYEVKKCIDILGKNNGLILSPGIAIMTDVPIENVLAMIEAMKELNS